MSPMAKKKNIGRKHRFKHAEPSAAFLGSSDSGKGVSADIETGRPRTAGGVAVAERDFSYVPVDLRRIGMMATGFLCLQLLMWYLFGNTSIGNTIYNLVQV
jgi:hypothetical protein